MVSTKLDEGRKIRVMLVDDSAVFLRAASFYLHQYPEIEVVSTLCRSDEAVAQAQLLRPQIVLLDPGLPGRPGLEIIAQLKAVMPETRVIILTLLDIEPFRYTALAAGAAALVSKMSVRTDLLAAIRRAAGVDKVDARAAVLPPAQKGPKGIVATR
ncbi:MAG: response regulator transcription factor [Anaerolineae bacterium]